jgi:cation diffusion facilitator family transporter
MSETRVTVLVAGTVNVLVGAIKLAAGIMVGSSAMLAEAAHSAADTLNQGLLLTSVHRGERPADPRHPFGYGQERYFWSLLAAFGIFIAGAGFSVFEGVLALRHGSSQNPLIAYVVLAVSAVAEGTSLVRVLIQFRKEARRSQLDVLDHVRSSADTTPGPAIRLATRRPPSPRTCRVARVLGTRHLIQAALTAVAPQPAVFAMGRQVDAAHAASMLLLAAVSQAGRRAALADALTEAALAAAGWAASRSPQRPLR